MSKNIQNDSTKELINRLNILIHLNMKHHFELPPKKKKSMEPQVRLLKDMGMEDYKEIAKVLGASPGSVANIISNLKKREDKKFKK